MILKANTPLPDVSGNVGKAVVELFDLMQKQTNMAYPSSEQARINQFISETQMPEENWLREGEQTIQFPESVNEEVAKYFAEIRNVFQVDFSVDWEFDQVLRIFFLQLAKGTQTWYIRPEQKQKEEDPMTYTYRPRGVCSQLMEVEVEDGKIRRVQVLGGCDGNLQGISRLVVGMDVDEAISRMEGIRCGGKPTSCPDQLAQALKACRAGE